MTGDGTNDAPALAQADVGVAMNTGTQAAKEAGNMVDLDSNPTKLIEVVEIGKQLLMTRGALTTFSIANDVAKYFAIIPAMFAGTFPVLNALNIMHLRDAAVGDSVGRDFQRGHHHRADPAGAARREVSADGRGGAAAPQSLDLRRRRDHRAVHRDQADRHADHASGSRVEGNARGLMKKNLMIAILMTVVTTILLGIIYPLVVTGLAQVMFPDKANGQLISQNGTVVGSRIIGQAFAGPGYFHSRPSAAGNGYDAANSRRLEPGADESETHRSREHGCCAPACGKPSQPVPVDLVTTSASGLDPDITPAAAEFQVERIARERGVSPEQVRQIIQKYTSGRQLGFLGEPRVNVLEVNLALDETMSSKKAQLSLATHSENVR